MKRFREIRFASLIVPGICTVSASWFLFNARGDWNNASTRFNQITAELSRLERLAPYPSEENLRQVKAHADDYEAVVRKLKDELRTRVLPLLRLEPNEFQSHLRVAMTAIAEKARANGVKLPEKFHLGFDEFVAALPNEVAAPLLGQELAQTEWILNTLIEARVDALLSLRRALLPEEHGAASDLPSPIPPAQKTGTAAPMESKVLVGSVVEATFVSTPAAARRVLNQIAGANEQFFIIRLLHIRNEKDKGPLREVAANGAGDARAADSPAPVGAPGTKSPAGPALNFIVGNERIETTATIEMVRFPDGQSGE